MRGTRSQHRRIAAGPAPEGGRGSHGVNPVRLSTAPSAPAFHGRRPESPGLLGSVRASTPALHVGAEESEMSINPFRHLNSTASDLLAGVET